LSLPKKPLAQTQAPIIVHNNQQRAMSVSKMLHSTGHCNQVIKQPRSPPLSAMREKPYELNEKRAVEKKISACSRHYMKIKKHDSENYSVIFNTSSFELARTAITGCFRLDGSVKTGRNLDYTVDKDQQGLIVSEVIKIKSWAMLDKTKLPAASIFIGSCSFVISLYRTRSSCLINGSNASDIMKVLTPAFNRLFENNKDYMQTQNLEYKRALQQHLRIMTSSQLITDDVINNHPRLMPQLEDVVSTTEAPDYSLQGIAPKRKSTSKKHQKNDISPTKCNSTDEAMSASAQGDMKTPIGINDSETASTSTQIQGSTPVIRENVTKNLLSLAAQDVISQQRLELYNVICVTSGNITGVKS
jgi:hypothetical protein